MTIGTGSLIECFFSSFYQTLRHALCMYKGSLPSSFPGIYEVSSCFTDVSIVHQDNCMHECTEITVVEEGEGDPRSW